MTPVDEAEHKFTTGGEVRDFRGNTVICFIDDPGSPIFCDLEWAQEQLKSLPFSAKLAYVPPATFHMTVIPLIDQTHRNTRFWPTAGGTESDIKAIDEAFKRAIDPIPKPDPIRMTICSCTACRVNLAPYDEETEEGLHQYREKVAAATGLRLPGHDTYRFHITLSYELEELTSEERGILDLVLQNITARLMNGSDYFEPGPPKFVVFNNMYGFYTNLAMRDAN